MHATVPVTRKSPAPFGTVPEEKLFLNRIGLAIFAILMIYPFVAQYLPVSVRQYLSAPFK
jgi:hypothetical protein